MYKRQVKGWYKYESGKDFYTCESDATDKATIDVSKGEYADQYSIKEIGIIFYMSEN